MLWFEFSGATLGALTETRVAKRQSRCKEFRRIQSCTRQSTTVNTVARTWETPRSYSTCLLHLLPSFLASTIPSLLYQNKSVPFSHLLSLHLSKGSAKRRFHPQLPPMITSSLLTSPLMMLHQDMSLYHLQHLTLSTRLSTFQISLMMSFKTSLNLDSFPLSSYFKFYFNLYAKTNCVIYIVVFLEIGSSTHLLFSILMRKKKKQCCFDWFSQQKLI